MPDATQCPECAAELPSGLPKALCPRCALKGALELSGAATQAVGIVALNQGSADAPPAAGVPPATPKSIGDYELLGLLGRGGMGVVYRARQKSLNRLVAVKMLLNSALSSPAAVRRFELEAETVGRLDHPHIVPIYEVREEDGQCYFSMKLIEGESLARLIARKEFTPPPATRSQNRPRSCAAQERIARLMATIAHAVHYAHSQGVLHRDIKPGNILVDREGRPHLTDFGLAKVDKTGSLTGSGTMVGTPSYMAPEQAAGGGATVATDIYSLGVVLYELLTGHPPFRGITPIEVLRRIVDDQALHPSTVNLQVDRDLGVICMKAMEKDPLRRYASAVEMAADLERWLRHEPVLARPVGVWLRGRRWMRRNPVGTALIVALCAGLSACLFLLGVVSDKKRELQVANNILRKSISSRVDDLVKLKPPRPFEHFTAEELRILLGNDPNPRRGSLRFTVAAFVDLTPMQTLITGGKVISRIEESMQNTTSGLVSLDFRIYKDLAALREDLIRGDIHFASIDGRSCLDAQAIEPGVRALVCDRRPGLRAVIFVPTDSGLTSLGDLKGHSLATRDRFVFPTAFALEQLANAGLCDEDVACSGLASRVGVKAEPPRPYARKSPSGYFGDGANALINEVLHARTWDAGVALETRLARNKESVQWRRLVTFHIPEFLWVAGPKADAQSRDAFVRAVQQFKDPKDLEFMLLDTETDGFEFTTATHEYLEAIRSATRGQARFENCESSPTRDVPTHAINHQQLIP